MTEQILILLSGNWRDIQDVFFPYLFRFTFQAHSGGSGKLQKHRVITNILQLSSTDRKRGKEWNEHVQQQQQILFVPSK